MSFLQLLPVFFSALFMAAHFSRAQNSGLVIASVVVLFTLFYKRKWVPRAFQFLLILGGLEWIRSALAYVKIRNMIGQPWMRLAMILGAVALFTMLSGLVFRTKRLRARYSAESASDSACLAAFILTFALLAFVQIKVANPVMLLFERFIKGGGWLQIIFLAFYAAFIMERMLSPEESPKWRLRVWTLFSVVFFAQLALGIIGFDKFLITGELHLPIPAVVLAGPIFRGAGLFMPILFLSTIIISGPAWCSHLCYLGSWDNISANVGGVSAPRPPVGATSTKGTSAKALPIGRSGRTKGTSFGSRSRFLSRIGMRSYRTNFHVVLTVIVILAALVFRLLGVKSFIAAIFALAFGFAGVGVMLYFSRKTGTMVHCTAYCPLGLIAVLLGKISPFRIKIGDSCTDCMACIETCRYDSLSKENIESRKVGYSCTLCGDCVTSCPLGALGYSFLKLPHEKARTLFLVLIISLHAVFMGLARI